MPKLSAVRPTAPAGVDGAHPHLLTLVGMLVAVLGAARRAPRQCVLSGAYTLSTAPRARITPRCASVMPVKPVMSIRS